MKFKSIILFISLIVLCGTVKTYSQEYKEDLTKKYISWALMQAIPNPTLFQDTDGSNSRVQFGLKWNIIPINISFKTNKYITRYQFFMINNSFDV